MKNQYVAVVTVTPIPVEVTTFILFYIMILERTTIRSQYLSHTTHTYFTVSVTVGWMQRYSGRGCHYCCLGRCLTEARILCTSVSVMPASLWCFFRRLNKLALLSYGAETILRLSIHLLLVSTSSSPPLNAAALSPPAPDITHHSRISP